MAAEPITDVDTTAADILQDLDLELNADGINLVFATQNLGQLDTVWGRDKAETIAAGPRVAMFGPGIKDPQTLSYVEKLSGQTAVLTENVSRSPYGFQIQTSRSTSTQWRPLIQQSEVREIPRISYRTWAADPGIGERLRGD